MVDITKWSTWPEASLHLDGQDIMHASFNLRKSSVPQSAKEPTDFSSVSKNSVQVQA